jgi:hypothetical protein
MATLAQHVLLPEQGEGAGDAGADDDPEALRLDGVPGGAVQPRVLEAGVRPGLPGRDQRHLLATVEPARLHSIEHLCGLDSQPTDDPGG